MNIEIKLTDAQEKKLKDIKDLDVFIHQAINKEIELLDIKKLSINQAEDMSGEKWRDIPGYEGYYQASNLGRIKSLDRTIEKLDSRTNKRIFFKRYGKISKLNYHHSKYFMVTLSKDGRSNSCAVHRLIALAFLPNELNLPIVNHKNGIRTDNLVSNLEWVSHAENVQHAIDTGLNKPCFGESHGSCRYTNEDILKIRKLYDEGHTQAAIGKIMKVDKSRIWEIVHRKTWKHI